MAEAIARDMYCRGNGQAFTFASRGVSVNAPCPAEPNAVRALRELYDIELNHTSSRITAEDMERADIVAAMTSYHITYINDMFPGYEDKVVALSDLAGADIGDISDPYGMDIGQYKKCAKVIRSCVEGIGEIKEGIMPETTVLGCDHAGYGLMQSVTEYMKENDYPFIYRGAENETDRDDYPTVADRVTDMILSGEFDRGIIICGTGIGVSIRAN